ncbi:MAG: hypothetical protein QE271_03520 [Bacteriovoracaceae bacterium]|nr:hypothetical protein [Bacteriovoracaceae bacterium]
MVRAYLSPILIFAFLFAWTPVSFGGPIDVNSINAKYDNARNILSDDPTNATEQDNIKMENWLHLAQVISLLGMGAYTYCPTMIQNNVVSFWIFFANAVIFTGLNFKLQMDLKKMPQKKAISVPPPLYPTPTLDPNSAQDRSASNDPTETPTPLPSISDTEKSDMIKNLEDSVSNAKISLELVKRKRNILKIAEIAFIAAAAAGLGEFIIAKTTGPANTGTCTSHPGGSKGLQKIAEMILQWAPRALGILNAAQFLTYQKPVKIPMQPMFVESDTFQLRNFLSLFIIPNSYASTEPSQLLNDTQKIVNSSDRIPVKNIPNVLKDDSAPSFQEAAEGAKELGNEGKKGIIKRIGDFVKGGLTHMVIFGAIATVHGIKVSVPARNTYKNRKREVDLYEIKVNTAIKELKTAKNSVLASASSRDDNDIDSKFTFDVTESQYIPPVGFCFQMVDGVLKEDSSCNCKTNKTCATIPEGDDKMDKFTKLIIKTANNVSQNKKTENPFYKMNLDDASKKAMANLESRLDSSSTQSLLSKEGLNADKIRKSWDSIGNDMDSNLSKKPIIAMKSSDQSQSSSSRNSFKDDTVNFPNFHDKDDKPSKGGIFINPDSSENLDSYNNDIRASEADLFKSIRDRYQLYRTKLEKTKSQNNNTTNPKTNTNYNSR